MHDTPTTYGCILCPIYRPDADPRTPERPPVCEADRRRVGHDLNDITRLHAQLVNPDPVEYDDRWYLSVDRQGRSRRLRVDPLAAVGGVGPIRARADQPAVSGSRQPPVPADLTAVDLTAPARTLNLTRDQHTNEPHQRPEDDTGHQSAATVLDSWTRDWRDLLWPDHHLPVPTVAELAGWLGNRVDQACDRHPRIPDFADELRALRRALRAAAGETEPQPTLVQGVACRDCDLRALIRRPGDAYEAECSACGLLYTATELRLWINQLGGFERAQRSPEEVAKLLRPRH